MIENVAVLLCAVSLVRAATPPLPSSDFAVTDWRKIVVVSDVHGDDLGFLKSLWIGLREVNETETMSFEDFLIHMDTFTNLPDAQNKDNLPPPLYRGSDVLLIQMGDVIDRGINGKACYRILSVIGRAIGWTTRFLYGNHDFAASIGMSYTDLIHPAEDIEDRRAAFGPGGTIRKFLLRNALLALRIVGSTLFVHGGMEFDKWLSEQESVPNIDQLNMMVREVAWKPTSEAVENILDPSGPLMTRPSQSTESCEDVQSALTAFGVHRMVVGHTIQTNRRVSSICEGRVVLSDVMISRWMTDISHDVEDLSNGQPSALIFDPQQDTLEAFYTESIEDEDIFSDPIDEQPQATDSVLGTRRREDDEEEEYSIVLYKDDLVVIQQTPSYDIQLSLKNEDQYYRIEYVAGEMVDEEGFPLPGIPSIYFGDSGPKRSRKNKDESLHTCRLELRMTPATPSKGEAILEISRTFHRNCLCLGFIPRESDHEDIRAMNPEEWIETFFRVDDNAGICLINLSRLQRCAQQSQQEAETEFIIDAFDLEADDASISSISTFSDRVPPRVAFGMLGNDRLGIFNGVENADHTLRLISPLIEGGHLGIPRSVHRYDSERIFVETTDSEQLTEVAVDYKLRGHVTAVFEIAHKHNLCLLKPGEKSLEDILSLFSVSDDNETVSLVDFSQIRACETEADSTRELLVVTNSFLRFFIGNEEGAGSP
jgi:hypothetical protein